MNSVYIRDMSQILEYRLLGEANLILPRPTLAAMEMTFVEYVQTLIEVVGVVVSVSYTHLTLPTNREV